MRKTTLKIAVAVLTFILGIVAGSWWIIYPHSLNQMLNGVPVDAVVTEEADEYAVYSTVINDYYIKNKVTERSVLILNRTYYYPNPAITSEVRIMNLKEFFPSVSDEMLSDFEARQGEPVRLQSSFNNLPVRYLLVDESIYKNYRTDSVIKLSRVGFDKERDQAFVYIDFFCAGLCGRGNFVTLEKVDGVWTVKKVFNSGFLSS